MEEIRKEFKEIELTSKNHAKNNESLRTQLKEFQSKNTKLLANIKRTTDNFDHKINQLTEDKRKIEVHYNEINKKLANSESENKGKDQEIQIKAEEIQMIRKDKEATLEEFERFKRKENSWNLKFKKVMVKPEIFEKMMKENPECVKTSSSNRLKNP